MVVPEYAVRAARALDVLRRVRHVHIPDVPPTYSPPSAAELIQERTEHSIRMVARERSFRAAGQRGNLPTWYRPAPSLDWNCNQLKFWVGAASPPPVVLTFTSRPVYELPGAAEAWSNSLIIGKCEMPLWVALPPPSGFKAGASDFGHKYIHWDPTQYRWREAIVETNSRAQEPTYRGPGVLSITTSLDVVDVRDDETLNQKIAATQNSIQQATIAVLAAEYGLDAHTIDGSPGLWVVSRHKQAAPAEVRRQIATFAPPQTLNGVVRLGVSIHLGYPTCEMVMDRGVVENPWARIGQKDTVTSVAAEVCGDTLRKGVKRLNCSPTVRWQLWERGTAADDAASLFSLVHWKTTGSHDAIPAPLGMDNYDVASVWALGFAAQCGIEYVDHYSDTRSFVPRTVSQRRRERDLAPMPRIYRIDKDDVSNQYRRIDEYQLHKLLTSSLDVAHTGQVPMWKSFVELLGHQLEAATLGVGPKCFQRDDRLKAWKYLEPWRYEKEKRQKERVSPMARAAEAARGWETQP